jgi:uncharacterized phage-associated protein
MPTNIDKYENTILYLASKLGGSVRGKKKLAKLLYFVDFDYFEKYESSITGATYVHLPMGPFPSELMETVQSLVSKGLLGTSSVANAENYSPTEVFTALSEPDLSVFGAEEIAMMDRVAGRYGELNGGQLEQLSHAEAPYIATEMNEEIPYELSFYRSTDFVEQNA